MSGPAPKKRLNVFERYLSVWVVLCMGAGASTLTVPFEVLLLSVVVFIVIPSSPCSRPWC